MSNRLSPSTILLLSVPPLLWAGNAIVGRLVREAVPPMTLNLLRWTIALLVLVPLGWRTLGGRGALYGIGLRWRRYALLGLLGIGMYNSLQYLALQSSTPINVTLVASGMPVWMMLVGRLFYGVAVKPRQVAGAVLSIAGVLVVLCRGDVGHLLALRLVAGDLYMILATIAWSFYSRATKRRCAPTGPRSWQPRWRSGCCGRAPSQASSGDSARNRSRGAATYWRPCCSWPSARPCSRSPCGAPASAAPDPASAPSSST
jgi:drug/metabolite transporter (DMT)-like permease